MTTSIISRDDIAVRKDEVLLTCQQWSDSLGINEAQSGAEMTNGDVLALLDGMDDITRVAKMPIDLSETPYPLEADLAQLWVDSYQADFGGSILDLTDVPEWVVRGYGAGELETLINDTGYDIRVDMRHRRELASLELAGRV